MNNKTALNVSARLDFKILDLDQFVAQQDFQDPIIRVIALCA